MEDITDDPSHSPAKCVYVLSDVDGYKYKLVLQGPLQQLTVRRIKKHLQKAAGLDPTQQHLSFNGVALVDDARAADAGLFDGAILRLQQKAPDAHVSHLRHAPSSSTAVQHVDEGLPSGSTPRDDAQPWETSAAHVSEAPRGASASLRPSPSTPPPPRNVALPQHGGEAGRFGALLTHTDSRPRTTSQYVDVSSSANNDTQDCCHGLEGKVAALSVENVRLREQLTLVARQAAEAKTDWRLEEEVKRLKAALLATKKDTAEASTAAAYRWRAKEEELVRELDLLREERRRLQADAAAQEASVQALLHSMEGEIRSLKHEGQEKEEALQAARLSLSAALQRCRRAEDAQSTKGASAGLPGQPAGLSSHVAQLPLTGDIDTLAAAAMGHLSYHLATPAPLQLDPGSDTCVVPVSSSLNLLVTLDRETERLYLYVTLLDALPTSPVQRLRLYEALLEGALLGKDMAGGGVGLSTESDLVLMSTSTDLRHNGAMALAAAAPTFVESAIEWEGKIDELLRH